MISQQGNREIFDKNLLRQKIELHSFFIQLASLGRNYLKNP